MQVQKNDQIAGSQKKPQVRLVPNWAMYIARTTCGAFVKVGNSTHPHKRLGILQNEHRKRLRLGDESNIELLILIRECEEHNETSFKRKFRNLQIGGDYFRYDSAIIEYVESIRPLGITMNQFYTPEQEQALKQAKLAMREYFKNKGSQNG